MVSSDLVLCDLKSLVAYSSRLLLPQGNTADAERLRKDVRAIEEVKELPSSNMTRIALPHNPGHIFSETIQDEYGSII